MSRKLLFLTLNLDGGGSEKIFTRLVTNLCGIYEVVVVTFFEEGIFLSEIKKLPIKYHSMGHHSYNTIFFTKRLHKLIKSEKPEMVISFLYYPNIISYLALKRLNIKHIPSERSNHRMYLKHSFKHTIWKILLKYSYQSATKIITLTTILKSYIMEDFKISDDKIEVIPNGLNFENLEIMAEELLNDNKFDTSKVNLVALGSICEPKNYPLLIEAFSRLHQKHPETRLHIIGAGELMKKIREIIKLNDLESEINLTGYIKNPYPYLKKADCYVMSSKWEGFPNALIEAMFINGHVVSTDCPTGPADIITHEHDGLLSANDDAEKLAENLERILYDNDLRNKLYNNSRISIQRFDEKNMIDKYRRIIEEN